MGRQARLSRCESHGWNANPDSLKQVSRDPDCIPSAAADAAGLPCGILKGQSGRSKTPSQSHSVSSVDSSDGAAGTSGDKSVKGLRSKVYGLRSNQVLNLAGDSSLHQSVALIEQSDLCIGNDTFGLHAAIAVGTPSVVIMWGGDGDRWIPWGDPARHRMVRAAVDCAGCGGECVKERHECMAAITPEMVWECVSV